MSNTKTILIMAGGTGGHVFPGLSVAHYLRAQGHTVAWLGTLQGLDTTLVPKEGIDFHQTSIRGLRGKGFKGLLSAPFKIIKAIVESLRIIKKVKPDVVLGMGGYVAGPGGVAAWILRIPLVIHEQNAIAGKTNLLLSRIARKCLEAFPKSLPSKYQAEWVGNPVRHSICDLPNPSQRTQGTEHPLKVLVFGGSQGAQVLSKHVFNAVCEFSKQQEIDVWHQAGENNFQVLQSLYSDANISVKLESFIDDMTAAYAWADLVICRAGALTISELCNVGVASILVPFPYAVDDHQTENAQLLVKNKAAIIIQESDLDANKLVALLNEFSNNRTELLTMACNARQLAKPDATQRVSEICLREAL
jgi:UDP-N-acetylglucosamine--N-acetylmuramyl-(pentapeptide) pyrophosphoryl-undecaprenol N-acetylglucosamine transferase